MGPPGGPPPHPERSCCSKAPSSRGTSSPELRNPSGLFLGRSEFYFSRIAT